MNEHINRLLLQITRYRAWLGIFFLPPHMLAPAACLAILYRFMFRSYTAVSVIANQLGHYSTDSAMSLVNLLINKTDRTGLMPQPLNELEAYSKEHFSTEEHMLKAAGYNDLKAHHEEHRAFEKWLSTVRQTFSAGVTSPIILAETVNAFLRGWLNNHILSSDMAYKELLTTEQSK